jgi:Fe-S cluster biogenesis protein NfuA|tara:strand:+ start:1265 stop:1585 length:321 start_codon:yes stop_codon:yes gene_type:complete
LLESPPYVQRYEADMVDKQLILDSVGPVQAVLDAHDGVVNVIDTTAGVISISLEGGCTGCSATPMTAMQIYYSLMKLDEVNDVIFVNGELPAYMRSFIDDKIGGES